MIERLINGYVELLSGTGMSDGMGIFVENATIIVVTILLALLADFLVKRIIISSIAALTKRTKNDWDDVFVKQKVFNRLAHLAPALIIYYALQYIFDATNLVKFLGNLTQTYMILMVLLVIDSVLNALHEIYMKLPISKGRNIKGFIQVVKIIFYFIAVILIISAFSEEPPKSLMAGLGAMAAVLLLIFKDTILGFVASIQLSANKMVNVGDWISMPKYNADGDVIDISLNTVKVQNWDKTIATIPTYALVSESFNNWKGMKNRVAEGLNVPSTST